MAYSVKEIYYTLQGEGAQAGRAAVFCRFTGCNLWSGREEHRATAVCRFCDTDFVGTDGPGGGKFASAEALASAVDRAWPAPGQGRKLVVCTGGEPLLQLDAALVVAFQAKDFEVAVETNGTQIAPPGLDWICVSPKAGAELVQTTGDELKLVGAKRPIGEFVTGISSAKSDCGLSYAFPLPPQLTALKTPPQPRRAPALSYLPAAA